MSITKAWSTRAQRYTSRATSAPRTLRISEADLVASQTGLMQRNRVRTALKRAHDRMWEEPGHIFSTKTERQALGGATHFARAMQGGRGRR